LYSPTCQALLVVKSKCLHAVTKLQRFWDYRNDK
jgi:hypothetical protein